MKTGGNTTDEMLLELTIQGHNLLEHKTSKSQSPLSATLEATKTKLRESSTERKQGINTDDIKRDAYNQK